MKLFTKEIDNKLFSQYSKGSDLNNQMVVTKIFNPYGKGVWYLLNSDPDDPEYIWAIVDLHDIEVGSVNRSDLENLKVPPFRLGLERDLYFTPVNAETLYQNLLSGKKYEKGGETEGDENMEMLENQAYNISHHSKELNNAIKHTKSVEPWVITKTQRATTDLTDVTHYLEGENAPKMANGGSTSDSDDGGYSIMRHKYYPWITIKLLESTNKGWKVEQTETKSPSGKDLRTPKTKIAYYRDSEIKGDRALFEKYEKGGMLGEFKKGDEGMYQGGEVRIIMVDHNSVIYQYLDKEGNRIGGVKRANKNDFQKSFAKFPSNKMASGGMMGEDKPVYESGIMVSKPYYFKDGAGFFSSEGYRLDNKFADNYYANFNFFDGGRTKKEAFEKANEFYDFVKSAKSREEYDNLTEEFQEKHIRSGMASGGMMAKGGEISKRKDGNLYVEYEGNKYIVAYSSDGYDNPYGIVFEDEDIITSIKSQKAKKVWNKLKPIIDVWKKNKLASGGMMAKDGATFAEKVSAIKSKLKGTKVPSKLQKDYGKKYSSKEAEMAAKRIAGAMRKKEL